MQRLMFVTPRLAVVLSCLVFLVAPVRAAEPGDVLEDVQADTFRTNCAASDPTCDTDSDLTANSGSIQVSTTAGPVTRQAALSAGFSVDDDNGGAPLIGSLLAVNVAAQGVMEAWSPSGEATYRLDLSVYDVTDGGLVATSKVDAVGTVDGVITIFADETVVLPLSLRRGHDYTVSLMVTAFVESVGDKAAVDILAGDNFFGWDDLTIRIGRDLGGELADLVDRVEDLEEINERLIRALRQLREDFEGHSHAYLTGKGTGHNNTVAHTSQPKDGDDGGRPDPDDGDDDQDKKDKKKKAKKKKK